MKYLVYLAVICLIGCTKTASTITPTPPASPAATSHQVKYVLFVNPRECELKGNYQDSAGRTIAVNLPIGERYALDTVNATDTFFIDHYPSRIGANYQIKIGEMAVGKSAYVKLTGCNKYYGNFMVGIAKDTTISGRTEYIVKKFALFNNPPGGTAELSYIVAN